jgi:TonB-linked SusC/RagA family outer membrane protein
MMLEETVGIDEVVAIGYGTSSRRKLTSAVTTIQSQQLTELAYSNVSQSLQGKAAGVIVSSSGGEPGVIPTVSIRGGGNPLYVIDGVVMSSFEFNNLNPIDIESISFLKDASATAIYGAKGADGIVLVTTKQGKKGIAATYSYSKQLSRPTVLPALLDGVEYMKQVNRGNTVEGVPLTYTDDYIQKTINKTDPYLYPNTNWRDLVLRDFAPEENHNLSINGGGERTNYYVSAGYFDQGSIFKSDKVNMQRYNLKANVTTRFDEIGLKLRLNVNTALNVKNEARDNETNLWGWLEAGGSKSLLRPYNPDGTLADQYTVLEVFDDRSGYNKYRNKFTYVQLNADWDIPWVKGLSAGAMYDFKQNDGFQKQWFAFAPQYDLAGILKNVYGSLPWLQETDTWSKDTYFQTYVNYLKTVKKHTIDAKLISEVSKFYSETFSAKRQNYQTSAIDQLFAGPSASTAKDNNGSAAEGANMAYIGRLKYDYAAKYIMEFSFRYDGSDNFAPGHRWGFFPSGSLAWVLSDEKFMAGLKDRHILDFLKLRGSYGKTGLTGTSRFPYIFSYSSQPNAYTFDGGLVSGYSEGGLVNPSLMTWYSRSSLNYGIDLAALNNKLSISADYFYYRTTGYLMSPLNVYATPLGKSLPQVNSSTAQRRAGVEADIKYKGEAGGLKYNVGLNFTLYQQLYERYDQEDSVALKNPRVRVTQEKDFGSLTYLDNGIFQSTTEILKAPRPLASSGIGPGDIAYQDINGDGKIDNEDKVRSGLPSFPHLMYGIDFGLNYKNWFMSGLFQGTGNRYVQVGDRFQNTNVGNISLQYQTDYWTPDNPNAAFARHTNAWGGPGGNNGLQSTFYMWNTKYFRLKNIQIGYDLKNGLLKKVNSIAALKVSLSGYNILTFSKIADRIDPESASFNYFGYPVQKTYALNVTLGF